MEDDLSVIQRIRDGDTESFRVLVERYQRPLLLMLRNLLSENADCEDLAQEAFLAAYANLDRFDATRASFLTWLLTIGRNKCVNALKKRRPIEAGDLSEIGDARTPLDDAAERETRSRLDRELAQLPLSMRTAFVLFEFNGLSHADIGRIEGIPVGTVKSRISRAKERLRNAMSDAVETC